MDFKVLLKPDTLEPIYLEYTYLMYLRVVMHFLSCSLSIFVLLRSSLVPLSKFGLGNCIHCFPQILTQIHYCNAQIIHQIQLRTVDLCGQSKSKSLRNLHETILLDGVPNLNIEAPKRRSDLLLVRYSRIGNFKIPEKLQIPKCL